MIEVKALVHGLQVEGKVLRVGDIFEIEKPLTSEEQVAGYGRLIYLLIDAPGKAQEASEVEPKAEDTPAKGKGRKKA